MSSYWFSVQYVQQYPNGYFLDSILIIFLD